MARFRFGQLLLAGLFFCFACHDLHAVDFDHEVTPILKQHCVECHGGKEAKGGFSINTRELFLESDAAVPGEPDESHFLDLIRSADEDLQMPPHELPRVPSEQIDILVKWVKQDLPWTAGFTFGSDQYQPPLLPREVELPGPDDANPIDQLLAAYRATHGLPELEAADDSVFLRRASLDLIGLLPTGKERSEYLESNAVNKQTDLIDQLLNRDTEYAEHWMTFWNDWLRNDYAGTGFITGGRKQISNWLYRSLIDNKPYDQFTRELVAPPDTASRGFIDGIKWRGDVSAGQTVEIQFAQSVAQSFLGINLKCASCHDSFIDRWKLSDAYSLAAVYSERQLDIHRCDKPTGEQAEAGWLFPELGSIDKAVPRDERLRQLADLVTHQRNGRYSRTIVNRLWAQLMGRGLIHPLDAMHTEPWDEDLLDFLANYLVDQKYDLKMVLRLIATSQAYAARSETLQADPASETRYVFRGRRAKRMTAEQFVDAVWQISDSGPTSFDAPVIRGNVDEQAMEKITTTGTWIWGDSANKPPPAGEQIVFRKTIKLESPAVGGSAVFIADNEMELYIARRQVASSNDWTKVQTIAMAGRLKKGDNEIVVVARNAGAKPNLAGLFLEARVKLADGSELTIATDETWQQSNKPVAGGREGRLGRTPGPWNPVTAVTSAKVYASVDHQIKRGLAMGVSGVSLTARASLLKSDFLMRSLGRPNRDQIVTSRPSDLTTLEAIDLANGDVLAVALQKGAQKFAEQAKSTSDLVDLVFLHLLSRSPTKQELQTVLDAIGPEPEQQAIEDLLWSVCMMPEFLMVR